MKMRVKPIDGRRAKATGLTTGHYSLEEAVFDGQHRLAQRRRERGVGVSGQ